MIVVPATVVALLGYVSLRQWSAASEVLFREQARDVGRMAADKVEMSLRMRRDTFLTRLQPLLADADPPRTAAIQALLAETPLIRRLHLVGAHGTLLYPTSEAEEDPSLVTILRAADGVAPRGAILVGDEAYIAVRLESSGRVPVLVAFTCDRSVLARDVLAPALGALESPVFLEVVDAHGAPLYGRPPLERGERVASVAFGESLPKWRVEVYERLDASPRQALRRQVAVFTAAFGVLVAVLIVGTAMTFRLIQRETEMTRLKSDFVAHVSHDLKTPLSVIRMFAETLEMGRVTDDVGRQHYLAVIGRESERLSRLIDNVLDFSRIEDGRQRYELRPTALEPLIRETLEAFTYPLEELGFEVNVLVDPELPDVVLDADAVAQALANLIDNAIKYASDGKSLTVEARRAGFELALAVVDRGPGIPTAEQARIFEKFYRVGHSEVQGRRGTGLGLALVRHVAEGHGGRVTVDSDGAAGSRFTLWLPLQPDA